MQILILEDNEERQAAMRECLKDRFHQFAVRFFDAADEMIEFLDRHLPSTILISLDHDLELKHGSDGKSIDPGTGRQVADFLARRPPQCPVVIATTNSSAAVGMEMALQEARWTTYRVLPFNDLEWVTAQWFPVVRRAIVASARRAAERYSASGGA
jgi:CheY-like chemotaxis protein